MAAAGQTEQEPRRMDRCTDTEMVCCGVTIKADVREFCGTVWVAWLCPICNRKETQELGQIDTRLAVVPKSDLKRTELGGVERVLRFGVYGP